MSGRWHPTKAGVGVLVIAAIMLTAGLMKTINLLILFGDLLLVLMALNFWIARQTALSFRLLSPREPDLYAYRTARRTLVLENTGPRAASVEINERTDQHVWKQFVASVSSGGSRALSVTFLPLRRGEYPLIRTLSSGYPFGFVRYVWACPAPPLVVFPALGRIDSEPFRRWLKHGGDGEAYRRRTVSRTSPFAADLRGVRPFRSGDAPRQVHWRTSARRGELLVREYDSPEALDLILVLDSWLPSKAEPANRQDLEDAISQAGSILNFWCTTILSSRVALVLADSRTIEGRASPHLARKLLQALAKVNGSSEFRLDARSVCSRWPRAVRLLISSRSQPGSVLSHLRQFGGVWKHLAPQSDPTWYHPPQLSSHEKSARF